jgi:hypothetical protein
VPRHDSFERKLACARLLRNEAGISRDILVDDQAGTVHRSYGRMPNMTWVIDCGGRVAYKADWTSAADVEAFLDRLLGGRTGQPPDEGSRTLTYQASGLPTFVTAARGTWTVTPAGRGKDGPSCPGSSSMPYAWDAVVGLALVTAHPGQVRTLAAHEPPVIGCLPDRAHVRRDPGHLRHLPPPPAAHPRRLHAQQSLAPQGSHCRNVRIFASGSERIAQPLASVHLHARLSGPDGRRRPARSPPGASQAITGTRTAPQERARTSAERFGALGRTERQI